MNFWYDGFPVVRLQLGADAGMSYWYDGFPVVATTDAVATDGAFVFVTPTPEFLMEATVAALVVPVKMTQLGRQVGTEEAQPVLRMTQLGRQGVTEEDSVTVAVRVTQMGRQVLYPFTCVPVIPEEVCPVIDLTMAPAGIDCPTQSELTPSAGAVDGCASTTDIGTS